jgi:hypothetical protein
MRGHAWWLCGLVAMSGCALVKDVTDTVQGVLEPIVAVGLVTALDPPTSELVDLSELELGVGIGATVFLADARDVSDLAQAPVTGAELALAGCGASEALSEDADGTYTLVPGNELDGCGAAVLELSRSDVDPGLFAPFTLPDPPSFTLPERWTAGDDLVIPLAATDFDSGLVVVVDVQRGEVVFSNEPQGVRGYYDFLMGTGELADLTVPGSTFEEDATYVIVVTGLRKVQNRDIDEANTLLTVLHGGRARAYALTTVALP